MSRIGLATFAAVLTVTACGGGGGRSSTSSSPTAPATTPAPAPGPTFDWVVTHRFESVTGPDNCWVREQRERLTGVVFSDLEMSVVRSSGSIRIESPWFRHMLAQTSAVNSRRELETLWKEEEGLV